MLFRSAWTNSGTPVYTASPYGGANGSFNAVPAGGSSFTGGGGGGSGDGQHASSAGGSGWGVIKYANTKAYATSPGGYSDAGGNHIYKFISSGTISF